MHYCFIVLFLACLFSAGCGNKKTTNSDKFADHVRSPEFQTPAEEMAGFKLPLGFEVTLFASEPDMKINRASVYSLFVEDVDGDGLVNIVVSNKKGVFFTKQLGA